MSNEHIEVGNNVLILTADFLLNNKSFKYKL